MGIDGETERWQTDVVTIYINRKPYRNSQMTSHLTLQGQSQGNWDFEVLYPVMEQS